MPEHLEVPMLPANSDLPVLVEGMGSDPVRLRRMLAEVDEQGWDGPAGTALLVYALVEIVQPVIRMIGLPGGAARQAEATGWDTAWRTLRRPSIREAESPWGVVWVAVRRAVLSEKLAAVYGTEERTAWRLHSEGGGSGPDLPRPPRPMSLDALIASGSEQLGRPHDADPPSNLIDHLTAAFVGVGWPPIRARRVVRQIAQTAPARTTRSLRRDVVYGWRDLAVELDIPPWQARRATLAILGCPGTPGLAERVVREGVDVLQRADVRRLLLETVRFRKRSIRAA